MANPEHLEILKQGVEVWNRWRQEHPDLQPNLEAANLEKAILERYNLRDAVFERANLKSAYLLTANLFKANFRGADLTAAFLRRTDVRGANFTRANLLKTYFGEADLRLAQLEFSNLEQAELREANLEAAKFTGANLTGASLWRVQALGTDFNQCIFTGVCIEDWNINSSTILEGIYCKYVFLKLFWNASNKQYKFYERRPHDPDKIFAPGDFARLVRKAQETVDLIFRNGIDWQAFLNSYEQLKVEVGGDFLPIQAIENKGDGSFVVRIQAPPELDKEAIEQSFWQKYEPVLQAKNDHIRDLEKVIDILAEKQQQNIKMNITTQGDISGIIGDVQAIQGDSIMSGDKDIQIVRGNNNRTAKGNNSTFVQGDNNQMSQGEQVSTTEVIEMLAYLEDKIQNLTALPETEREKSIKRLEAAKVEATESEPDKESIAKSLKRVNETLNEAGETTQEVKELVKELFPTVVKVAGWLGYAAGKIWMI